MSLMPFAPSRPLSVGVELELQLLSCNDYNLVSSAPVLEGMGAASSHRYIEKVSRVGHNLAQ